MKLFILNPTSQKLEFGFRVPGERGVRYVPIGPFQQEMVYEGDPDKCYNIIAQHERYGLIEDTDIRAHRGYTSSIFALNRHVDITSATLAERQNHAALIARGEEMRKVSAVAAAEVVTKSVADAGFSPSDLIDTTLGIRGEDDQGQPAVVNEETVVRQNPSNGRPKRGS